MDSKKLLEQFDAFYEGVIVMVADMKSYKDMINELELKVQNQSQLILQLQEKLTTKDIIIDDKLTELHQILQRDNINLSEIIKDVNLSVQIIEFSCEVSIYGMYLMHSKY